MDADDPMGHQGFQASTYASCALGYNRLSNLTRVAKSSVDDGLNTKQRYEQKRKERYAQYQVLVKEKNARIELSGVLERR